LQSCPCRERRRKLASAGRRPTSTRRPTAQALQPRPSPAGGRLHHPATGRRARGPAATPLAARAWPPRPSTLLLLDAVHLARVAAHVSVPVQRGDVWYQRTEALWTAWLGLAPLEGPAPIPRSAPTLKVRRPFRTKGNHRQELPRSTKNPFMGPKGRTLERHELSPETQVHPSPRSSSNPVISYMDLRTNPKATDGEP